MVASADLTLRGTYDRPVLFGHADIERGEVTFEGRRYRITRGVIDFTNPSKIEPFFDIEAETNVRVSGQTYRVTVGRRARPNSSGRRSAPIRRCRRRTCWRCSSATCSGRARRASRRSCALQNPEPDADRHSDGAGDAGARQPVVVGSRQGGGADVRRRHLPAHAVVHRSVQPADVAAEPDRPADDRQAHFRPRLPDVLAQPRHDHQRSDRAARVRGERSACRGFSRATRTRRPTRSSSA